MVKRHLKIIDELQLPETIAPYMTPERARYVSLALTGIAGLLLLVTLAQTVGDWISDYKITHMPLNTGGTATPTEELHLVDNIPQQHLFGEQPMEDTDFLPVTNLQMHLTGIVKNSRDGDSRVIISSEGQPGKVYAVGDEVTSGIKINAINDANVVLEHNGRFEKLPLTRQPLIFNDKPKTLWSN
jgi:type II secretory pathway component PulC